VSARFGAEASPLENTINNKTPHPFNGCGTVLLIDEDNESQDGRLSSLSCASYSPKKQIRESFS
jgi:hypothetical protein